MKIRRFLSLAVIAALIILTLAACGTQSSDSVTAPALMSKVTKYEMNYQTGEFELKDETEYEYENAYPVMMKYHDLMANLDDKTTFEYSFNDGRPVKMKSYDENGDPDMAVSYTKKGLRNREHYFIPNSTMELIYQYGNRDNYFTLVHHESVVEDPEDPEVPKDHAEEIDSVIVTTKDGLLEKTVNDGIFANWGDDEVKKWTRFMGSYTAEYDSNGIVSLTSGVYSVGESGPEARPCNYAWVLSVHMQCVEYRVCFSYHQTGAKLIKGGKVYNIPRKHQHEQAAKANLDYNGTRLLSTMPG